MKNDMTYTKEELRGLELIEKGVTICIALPHNDYYNGEWEDVILHDVARDDYVGVQFDYDESGDLLRHFPRKYVTIVEGS